MDRLMTDVEEFNKSEHTFQIRLVRAQIRELWKTRNIKKHTK